MIAIDPTVLAGTTAPVNMRKQNRLARWAGRRGIPLICLSDNDGGRIPDVMGWRFSGLPFDFNTFSQAPPGCPEIPRLIAVLGPAFGDAALQASMGDYVVMTEGASMALVGPPIVAASIGEELTAEELGGPKFSTAESGNAHAVADGRGGGDRPLKRALSYLPDSAAHPAPRGAGCRVRARGRRPARARADRPSPRLRHAPSARGDLRRRQHPCPGRSATAPSLLCSLARLEGQRGRGGREPADAARRRPRCGRDGEGGRVRSALRHLQHPARLPAGRARPDGRLRGRAKRRPAQATRTSSARSRACASRRSRSSCARPTAAATSRSAAARRTPISSSRGRPPSSGSWPRRPASRSSTSAGSRRRWRTRARRPTSSSWRSSARSGPASRSRGRPPSTSTSTT